MCSEGAVNTGEIEVHGSVEHSGGCSMPFGQCAIDPWLQQHPAMMNMIGTSACIGWRNVTWDRCAVVLFVLHEADPISMRKCSLHPLGAMDPHVDPGAGCSGIAAWK